MNISPKAVHRLNTIPIKLPRTVFTVTGKKKIESRWMHKGPRLVQALVSKKRGGGGIAIPNFKFHYRLKNDASTALARNNI